MSTAFKRRSRVPLSLIAGVGAAVLLLSACSTPAEESGTGGEDIQLQESAGGHRQRSMGWPRSLPVHRAVDDRLHVAPDPGDTGAVDMQVDTTVAADLAALAGDVTPVLAG